MTEKQENWHNKYKELMANFKNQVKINEEILTRNEKLEADNKSLRGAIRSLIGEVERWG